MTTFIDDDYQNRDYAETNFDVKSFVRNQDSFFDDPDDVLDEDGFDWDDEE